MTDPVKITNHGGLRLITICYPPVNTLSDDVRGALLHAVEQAAEDATVTGLAFCGEKGIFSAGADIKGFRKDRPGPRISDIADAIEASGKPSLALIDGFALGGGLELALGCSFRIASPEAKLGLPEVEIGIFPSAGGLQRLPRLIDFGAAVDLILTGRKISGRQGLDLGLVDHCAPAEELLSEALARHDALRDTPTQPLGQQLLLDTSERREILKAARAKFTRNGRIALAREVILTRLGDSLGQDYSAQIVEDGKAGKTLIQSSESRALRHLFAAERKAARASVQGAEAPESIGIAGAGTMGGGIAIATAAAGLRVRLYDPDSAAGDRAMQRCRDYAGRQVAKGRMTPDQAEAFTARIMCVDTLDRLGDCDLVIEAIVEDLDIKKAFFRDLQAVCPSETVFATNTSYLDLEKMAEVLERPGRLVGLHFFSPAEIMPLLEVVRGDQSSDAAFGLAAAYARRIGKRSVVMTACPGFVANRSRYPMMNEARLLVEDGATPEQVDRVLRAFGFPMGPFETADNSGLDVYVRGLCFIPPALRPGRQSRIVSDLVEAGRLGRKSGAGWYRYETDDRKPRHDPTLDGILADFRRCHGITPRDFSDTEILERCLYAAVNEAVHILEDGIIADAGAIDSVWVNGYGFPREKGGLLYWAQSVGLSQIEARIAGDFRPLDPERWPKADFSRLDPHAEIEKQLVNG